MVLSVIVVGLSGHPCRQQRGHRLHRVAASNRQPLAGLTRFETSVAEVGHECLRISAEQCQLQIYTGSKQVSAKQNSNCK